MEITLKQNDSKGYAMASVNGTRAGMMTFTVPSTEFIIIDHTEVEPIFKGKGVGKKLLFKIVAMAREKNIKIIPLCPYANAQFKKLTDIQDVLKQ